MTDAWTPLGPVGTTRPELAGSFGMVASTHWLASQVGMSVLERGGNAADAAVAAGFVLQVVEPHLNGPGGEVPLIVSSPRDGTHVVCGQGVAPAAATPQAFTVLGLDTVPGTGLLAATVPGAFGAWTFLLQRWGTWSLRGVLEPAIAYARDGAPVLPRVAATLAAVQEHFRTAWPTSARTYLGPDGVPPAWGRLRLEGVARTYARVLAEAEAASGERDRQLEAARDAWYRGFVAEEIGRFCAGTPWPDSSGRAHRGLLTAQDLASWEPTVEEPLVVAYGGVEVAKAGFWTQGPTLLQQLRLLEALGLDGGAPEQDPDGAAAHALVEAQKLVFADREAWYGDPDVVDVPAQALLSVEYARQRAALVGDVASGDLRPGAPAGRAPRLPALAEYDAHGRARTPSAAARAPLDPVDGIGLGEPTVRRGDTCHVDVVDASGLMVSATPSGAWLQSSPVVPALGFPLGTRAQMFRLEPGLPTTLAPGARPRTTLSPTMLLREGRGWVALGTPGGDQQDHWSLLLLLRLVGQTARGESLALQAAVDGPALHTEHAPSSFAPRESAPRRVVVEDRWPHAGRAGLHRRGHDVREVPGWSLGRLSAVARQGEWLRAAANPRGAQGYAVGR